MYISMTQTTMTGGILFTHVKNNHTGWIEVIMIWAKGKVILTETLVQKSEVLSHKAHSNRPQYHTSTPVMTTLVRSGSQS